MIRDVQTWTIFSVYTSQLRQPWNTEENSSPKEDLRHGISQKKIDWEKIWILYF